MTPFTKCAAPRATGSAGAILTFLSHDRNAWLAQHVLPHEPDLRARLQRRRIDGLETDDIIQETYAVLATLAEVGHINSPRSYAFQTARSVILHHLRRAQTVAFHAVGDIDLLNAAADEPSPERQVTAREALRQVNQNRGPSSEIPGARFLAVTQNNKKAGSVSGAGLT